MNYNIIEALLIIIFLASFHIHCFGIELVYTHGYCDIGDYM